MSASQPTSSGPAATGDAQSKGRRRIPTPDLDAIEDPAERRRQQRLAKTRANAAVTRCCVAQAPPELPSRTRAWPWALHVLGLAKRLHLMEACSLGGSAEVLLPHACGCSASLPL